MNEVITIQGIDCYEEDGTVYLNLEQCARGLGFTTVAKSGNEVVRWNTVHKYMEDLSVATSCNDGSYQDRCPKFIPENIFYRLAMKAKNEVAERFQAFVADEVIPSIRKHGGYIAGQEDLSERELLARALVVANNVLAEREKRLKRFFENLQYNNNKEGKLCFYQNTEMAITM